MSPKPLVSPVRLAERLGVTRRHLYNMVRGGLLPPPIRLGPRTLRWQADVIDEWLADREKKHAEGVQSGPR